ncbi:MAG: gluconokinase [Usitatibacter sp.]
MNGNKLVVMGVAGSGKSTLGQALSRRLGYKLIEGDEHHLPASKAKMLAGIPLDDADREPWLDLLGDKLAASPTGAVLTCSALKRSYRDRLRARAPGLKFVFIDISQEFAVERVAARPAHMFPPSLVANQFATLESPRGEPGVITVFATESLNAQVDAVTEWLEDPA